jgi:hypothetical protein
MAILKDVQARKFVRISFVSPEIHVEIFATSFKYIPEEWVNKSNAAKMLNYYFAYESIWNLKNICIPYNVNILLVTAQVSSAGPIQQARRTNYRETHRPPQNAQSYRKHKVQSALPSVHLYTRPQAE